MVKVFADRGLGNIRDMVLNINDIELNIPNLGDSFNKSFNIRIIFEFVDNKSYFGSNLLGNKIISEKLEKFEISAITRINLVSKSNSFNFEIITENVPESEYFLSYNVYQDVPLNNYNALNALPIPINVVTFHFLFSKENNPEIISKNDQKYFDGFSHLGFFLADLPRMKKVIEKEYGEKKLDLVYEFSNSEIIDKLFKEEIIMIVWGINPYTYPIYSSEKTNLINIKPLLGNELGQDGIFNINEDLKELSIIPGSELSNWPDLLQKDWTKIKLHGKGKKTYLKPFSLKNNSLETVMTSFLIYRDQGELQECKPLINVDLLYS